MDKGDLNPKCTIVAIFPLPRQFGGPSEVLQMVSSHLTCGVTHFVVTRDMAGILHPDTRKTTLYDPTHAAKVVCQAKLLLGNLEIVTPKSVVYNKYTKQPEFIDEPGPDQELAAHFQRFDHPSIFDQAKAGGSYLPLHVMCKEAWDVLTNAFDRKY